MILHGAGPLYSGKSGFAGVQNVFYLGKSYFAGARREFYQDGSYVRISDRLVFL